MTGGRHSRGAGRYAPVALAAAAVIGVPICVVATWPDAAAGTAPPPMVRVCDYGQSPVPHCTPYPSQEAADRAAADRAAADRAAAGYVGLMVAEEIKRMCAKAPDLCGEPPDGTAAP